jgi:transketolase
VTTQAGDIGEGISHEVSSLAGHHRLGNLIVLYDDNQISIEDDTNIARSEDVCARYEARDESCRREVLPPAIRARVSVEAGITAPWRLYTGETGASIGVDHFGASAAYQKIYQEFGITAERVAAAARDSLARV